jgi:hypothetical protein
MSRSSRRGFADRILVVAAFGFVLRVVYLFHLRDRPLAARGDGNYYHAVANLVAAGKGFVYPFTPGQPVKSALHPPLWTLTLAMFARVGVHSVLSQQVVAALVGVATIVATGYAGRRIAGPSVGLLAAVIAAVAPSFFFYEWELLSETLSMLGAALIVLFAYRFRDQPSLGGAVIVGLMCGLLALTHSEQALLVVLLLAPLVLLARNIPRRTRCAWLAAATAVAIGVLVPWAIYNTARFREPVLLSTEFGSTLAIANCAPTYSGARIGYASAGCLNGRSPTVGPIQDESTLDVALRRVGVDFISHHLGRVPVVIAAREGRTFGVFRPGQQMRFDTGRGTPDGYIRTGFFVTWALEIAAIAGIVALRKRRIPVYPILSLIVSVAIGVALTYGATRFRAPAEASIALLAAVGIETALRRLTAPSSRSFANTSDARTDA